MGCVGLRFARRSRGAGRRCGCAWSLYSFPSPPHRGVELAVIGTIGPRLVDPLPGDVEEHGLEARLFHVDPANLIRLQGREDMWQVLFRRGDLQDPGLPLAPHLGHAGDRAELRVVDRLARLQLDEVRFDSGLEGRGRARRDDLAVIDDRDLLAERVRLLDVVAREQDGDSEFLVHAGDEVPKHPPRVRIEADRRFVHEHDLRLMQQRQRDLEFLAHARGKGLHSILAPVVESKVRQEVARALLPLREALQLRLEPEVLPGREIVVEDDLGRDPTDPLLHVHRIPTDVVSGDPGVAFRHVGQAREQLDHRRLAGAVRTEEPEDGPRGDLHVDVVDGRQLSVDFREIFRDDGITRHAPPRSLRKDPHRFLSHLDHDLAEFVRLLRGDLAHVRPEELPRGPEFSEQRGSLRADRGFERAEALLDLFAAAPGVGPAFAGDPVRLAAFLAAHGKISFAQEGPQSGVDRPRARPLETPIPLPDRPVDLLPPHRAFFEQVEDEALEVALAEEVEESTEFLRAAHDASSFRRNRRIARTAPTTAYAAKTSSEVAGSGTKPTSTGPPGPGRTAVLPRTFEMIPDADVGMNQGSIFAAVRSAPTILKIRVNKKNVRT